MQNEAEISKTRSLPNSWAPPLPLTFQKSIQRNACHGLLVSNLTDIADLTYCDMLWFSEDEEGQESEQEVPGSLRQEGS